MTVSQLTEEYRRERARQRLRPVQSPRTPVLLVIVRLIASLISLSLRVRTALLEIAGCALIVSSLAVTFGAGAALCGAGLALLALNARAGGDGR